MDHLVGQFGPYQVVKSFSSTMTRYQIIRIDFLESCDDLPNVLVGQWRHDVETAAWVKSWNSFARCSAVSPMPVSATDGLVLRPPHAAQLSSEVSAMR
jgi:hypothetical protein